MSGASEAAAVLADACADQMGPLRLALDRVRAVTRPSTGDLIATMQDTAALILALEVLSDAANPAPLRAALASTMADTGCTRLDLPHHVVSLTDPRRTVIITDAKALPAHLLADPQPDKRLIAAELQRHAVPGAELSNGGLPSLRFLAKKD